MIYFAQATDGGPVKIGHSIDVVTRLRNLEWYYNRPLALLATMPGGRDVEQAIHARFAHLRFGRTEQFRPAADLMEFLGRPLLVGPNPEAVERMEVSIIVGKTFTIRGSQEFKDWLEAAATYDRNNVAMFIERACVHYARSIGFTEPAPER